MENEMETLGPFKGVYRDITPIMENQMEKKMENEMESGIIRYFMLIVYGGHAGFLVATVEVVYPGAHEVAVTPQGQLICSQLPIASGLILPLK